MVYILHVIESENISQNKNKMLVCRPLVQVLSVSVNICMRIYIHIYVRTNTDYYACLRINVPNLETLFA